jgi:phosphoglycerol transferase MdoB-like AlkP superfamily enzyme
VIQIYIRQVQILLKRISICYLAYFISRLSFFLINRLYFSGTGFYDFLKISFFGLRFDSFSIVVSNSVFILLSILPFNFFYKKAYQLFLQYLFFLTNAVFISVNFIDAGYFPFIHKRSTYDLFLQIGGQSDLGKLLPQFLIDFWWILFIYLGLLAGLAFLYKKIKVEIMSPYQKAGIKQWSLVLVMFLFTAGLSFLAVRGGVQRIPIDIVNAGALTEPEETPIVLNTPFTLIKSVDRQALEDYDYYTLDELKKLYSPVHHFKDASFKKQNVVILILESFSKEYTQLGKTRSITPFLDSLMAHSLVFTNGFSNGTRSIEGIPAILSSLPSLMDNPFINSIYANNEQTSLASVLNKEGYETAFFHGGINGTMNFDSWAASAGYRKYFGKNEYNNDGDFDDFWGIWDEPFLKYSVKKMEEMKEPFHTAIFTLSSHHPYFVPAQYKNKFPKGQLENTESIEYADYALKQFFAAAKKTKWYNNTLFVLTADHASISEHPFFSNVLGNLTIPILFFDPKNALTGQYNQAFSQMDILPSTLELLGYNKPFFSFGQSYLSRKNAAGFYYSGGGYYFYNDSMMYCIVNNKLHSAFNYKNDSSLTTNMANINFKTDSLMFSQFKPFIQTYNHTLINNSGAFK